MKLSISSITPLFVLPPMPGKTRALPSNPSLPPPPSATDGDSLFCILSGEMSGVICDQSDPQLVAAAHIAARQLLFSASEEKEVGVP